MQTRTSKVWGGDEGRTKRLRVIGERSDGGWSEYGPRYPRASHTIRRTNGDEGDCDGAIARSSSRPRPIDKLHHQVEPIRDTSPRLHHREKKSRHMIPKKRRVDLRSHGYLFAISSDLFHVISARGCEEVRYFSHQKGRKLSENGFPGLIGGFGERRHNSPRVTGMAAGQPKKTIRGCRSSSNDHAVAIRQDNRRMAFSFASLRADPVNHAIHLPAFVICNHEFMSNVDLVLYILYIGSSRRPFRFQFGP